MSEKYFEKEIELRSEEFQEVQGAIPPWILRWGITIVAIFIFILLFGSAVFKYPDIISSTVTLTGTSPVTGIVARSSGNIYKLFISDNQVVKSGEYLAIIENSANMDNVFMLKQYLKQINGNLDSISSLPPKNMNLGNIQSLYSSFYITLSDYFQFNQLDYYKKKIDFMKDRINRNEQYLNNLKRQKILIEKQLSISQKQYMRDSSLNKRGVLSNEEIEKSYSQSLQGHLSLENMHATIESMQIQIVQLRESLLDTEYQYLDKKHTLETQLKSYITQLQTEIQIWELNYVIIAPINGKITFTKYWVENQNVTEGEEVFNVIPFKNGELIGKALLPIERSGKVKIGQNVNISFSNFPDTEFGVIKGVVRNISRVPLKNQDVNNYIVEIKLPEGLKTTYNKRLPFLPEMEGKADIITDDLSLLERFILPIKKVLKESI